MKKAVVRAACMNRKEVVQLYSTVPSSLGDVVL